MGVAIFISFFTAVLSFSPWFVICCETNSNPIYSLQHYDAPNPPVCTHKSLLLPNPWQPKHPFPRRFPLSYETLVFSPCRTSCISPWDRSLTWSSSLTLLWEGWTKGGWNSVFLVCYALLNYSHRLKKIKWCNGHRYQRLCFITACNFKSVIEPWAISAKTDSWDDRWGLVA